MEPLVWIMPLSLFLNMIIMFFLFFLLRKSIIKSFINPMIKRFMEEDYHENLWEVISGLRRTGLQTVVENSLRAKSGKVIHRPLGSPFKLPNFEPLVFRTAQIQSFATSEVEDINMKVTIGPRAKRPLQLNIPLLISPMGYGVAISYNVKLAFAKAAAELGTAVNSGEGPFLQEERNIAKYYILQYSAAKWAKEPEAFKQADMIEFHLAQGASAGIGAIIPSDTLSEITKQLMGLKPKEDGIIHETFVSNQTQRDLKKIILDLRKITSGIPIGAKISASTEIEKDLEQLIKLGLDFVTIDGGQASTKGAAPILEDDFGIPTIHGLVRAVRYFKKKNVYKKISILVSGGLYVPGDFLKAIALGADAVYLGSSILFAMSHTQVLKALPWEPPTALVWYIGKHADEFNTDEGAKHAANFLKSCIQEMETGIRALGKTALHQVNSKDLACHDKLMAEVCGVPFTGHPMEREIDSPIQ